MKIRETFATTIQKIIEPVVKVSERRPAIVLDELSKWSLKVPDSQIERISQAPFYDANSYNEGREFGLPHLLHNIAR